MDLRLSARIGAFACLGVAAGVTVLSLREAPKPSPPPVTLSSDLPIDPLQAKLRSCQLAGQAAGSDPGCLAAWAENRRRFLGIARSRQAEPELDPAPGKSSQAVPLDTVSDGNLAQEK